MVFVNVYFFFSSRRRHTRWNCDWSSDVCSSDLVDGWSMGVIGTELATAYTALGNGETPDLPETTLHYADFAVWQRNNLSATRQLDYWRKQLADVTPVALPTDRPRPAVHTTNGAVRD